MQGNKQDVKKNKFAFATRPVNVQDSSSNSPCQSYKKLNVIILTFANTATINLY